MGGVECCIYFMICVWVVGVWCGLDGKMWKIKNLIWVELGLVGFVWWMFLLLLDVVFMSVLLLLSCCMLLCVYDVCFKSGVFGRGVDGVIYLFSGDGVLVCCL